MVSANRLFFLWDVAFNRIIVGTLKPNRRGNLIFNLSFFAGQKKKTFVLLFFTETNWPMNVWRYSKLTAYHNVHTKKQTGKKSLLVILRCLWNDQLKLKKLGGSFQYHNVSPFFFLSFKNVFFSRPESFSLCRTIDY